MKLFKFIPGENGSNVLSLLPSKFNLSTFSSELSCKSPKIDPQSALRHMYLSTSHNYLSVDKIL